MGTWGPLPTSNTKKRVEGHARSPGIRLGRGTKLSSLNLHPKPTTRGLVHIREHPWVLGQAMGTLTHKTHHGPDSREATTFPHIVFFTLLREGYIQIVLFPGTPKLEPRKCPKVGLPRLWTLTTPSSDLRLEWGLNQSCSSPQELFNIPSHSICRRWEEVDSWLLVVESQTTSLTPDPSFAHNLGCRYLNDQCEAILDIYTSRPFQWHQEHPNSRCFGLYCRTLNIRESRWTPNP